MSLSTTAIPNNSTIPDTSSLTEASNSSAAAGLPDATGTHQVTNARGTVRPNIDRTTQDYTIGRSMENFRRQTCIFPNQRLGMQQSPYHL